MGKVINVDFTARSADADAVIDVKAVAQSRRLLQAGLIAPAVEDLSLIHI